MVGQASLIAALALLAVAAAPARAVVGGQAAPGGVYGSATMLATGEQVCSGSLVTPRLVLTAAHCFEEEFVGPDEVARRTTAVIGNPNGGRMVQQRSGVGVVLGPADGAVRADVALLWLGRSSTQPLAELAPDAETPSLVGPGRALALAGFGASVSPPPGPDGTPAELVASEQLKEAALAGAECPPDATIERPAAFATCAIPSPTDAASGNACSGDSGAPAFGFAATIGRATQVAVVSGGVGPDQCSQTNTTVLTPLTGPVLAWLRAMQAQPEPPEAAVPRSCASRRAKARRAARSMRRAQRRRHGIARARARKRAADAGVFRHC